MGRSDEGNMSSFRLSPITATRSPSHTTQIFASALPFKFNICLPDRVCAITSLSGTTKPRPSLEATK